MVEHGWDSSSKKQGRHGRCREQHEQSCRSGKTLRLTFPVIGPEEGRSLGLPGW